ncbi:MAG TPA: creatininase family protein [bacterium]|nr:creatininase family protein [bacterium]
MKDTVLLEELSWPEVQAALDGGVRTVVIVTASIEQHGPHLPTMTDSAIGRAVGERVARKLGRALLAPVIRPGCSDHHLAFPGSLSLPRETFIETVLAYVRSLALHGFRNFFLFSSHGGNFDALEEAARRLRDEFASKDVRIAAYAGRPALREMMQVMNGAAESLGVRQDVDALHAELTETSIMMARHPALVATDRLEAGRMGRIDTDELFRRGLRAITPNGILGDARQAKPEIGAAVLERLADHLAAFARRKLDGA